MQATSVTWKAIPGWDAYYEASSLGQVRSWHSGLPQVLRPAKGNRRGHLSLNLCAEGRRGSHWVHKLVLEAFVGPCPEGKQVRHLNGDPRDNRLSNLAYGTPSENNHDTVRHGNHPQASKTHCPQGHAYSPENTYVNARRGGRICRACNLQQARKSRTRQASQ